MSDTEWIIIDRRYDEGTLSAPAFLELALKKGSKTYKLVSFKGKKAKRLSVLMTNAILPEEEIDDVSK